MMTFRFLQLILPYSFCTLSFAFSRIAYLLVFVASFSIFYSCSTSRHASTTTDYRALAKASRKLGVRIDYKDNHRLFLECAQWVGVPYRYGGKSRRGVDCSGLTYCIYRQLYGISLSPNSQMQLDRDVQVRVKKGHVTPGDLLFFSDRRSKRHINHVGIYLKGGKFIHASTSRGVRIDDLQDAHWKKRWVAAGRTAGKRF